MQTVLFTQLLDNLDSTLAIKEKALFGLLAVDDVLGHGAGLQQHEVLLHHADLLGDGSMGRAEVLFFAVEVDLSGGGLLQTVENFHQGGFAGTVFAYYGQDFALVQRQGDVIVGVEGTVYLGDVFHFQQQGNTPVLSI